MRRNSGCRCGRVIRGLAAAAVVLIGLCATAVAQSPSPDEPPPLTLYRPSTARQGETTPKKDEALERAASRSASPRYESLQIARDVFPSPKSNTSDRAYDAPSSFGTSFADRTDPASVPKESKSAVKWMDGLESTLRQHERLLERLDEEVRQHPDRAEAYFRRGYSRIHPPRDWDIAALDATRADFSRAVELDPDHVRARYWRGYVAEKRKDRASAISDYSWVIEHHPEIVHALWSRAEALARDSQYDRAINDLDQASTLDPAHYGVASLALRGCCYSAKGLHDRAIADLSRVIADRRSAKDWVYLARAKAYRATGQPEKALDDLDTALRIRPDSPAYHELRYEVLVEVHDYESAAYEAERLEELLPNQPGPCFLRSVASWLAAYDRDRDLIKIDRIAAQSEPILACTQIPRFIRALADGVSEYGWKIALADLDRCLAREPSYTPLYVLRAIHHANGSRYVPMCKDIAAAILTFDPREYSARIWLIDWKGPRFGFQMSWKWKGEKDHAEKQADPADPNQQCIDMAFQHLLASAFGPSR